MKGLESTTTVSETSESILSPRRNENLPDWFNELQREAWLEFENEPMPTRTDERWRFSTVKALVLDDWVYPAKASEAKLAPVLQRGYPNAVGRIVFLNDVLVSAELFDSDLERRGVRFLPLADALETHTELLRQHFMAQPARLGSRKFAALHKAVVKAGSFLYLPNGVVVEKPFEVFHLVSGENAAVFPHTLIVADESSRVTFLDHFVSLDRSQRHFATGVNDLVLGANSKLTYVSVQDWSPQSISVQINSTVAEADASALSLSLSFGGRYSRLESVSRMIASGARSDMLAVTVANDNQEFDQRTLQDHLQPDTTSDLLYKNALNDQARTVFSGLIKVERGAHRTDAYQKVRNLLLSDEAEANSMPGLEILADDVRCTHGATSGQVEAEELFYLKSRGIPERAAKALVVRGFLNEVIDRLEPGSFANYLHDQINSRL
jgi:Fe-S cluster assembly protein SufD